jgi:hypothetical protein
LSKPVNKYIFLFVVNIAVLLALFINVGNSTIDTDDPFDTEYVISLLQKDEKLVKTVTHLTEQLEESNRRLYNTQTQLEQTQILIGQSIQKNRSCELEKLIVREDEQNQTDI